MISKNQIARSYKFLDLDQRANAYLKTELENYSVVIHRDTEYPQPFLQRVLQRIDLSKGKVITCLPKRTNEEDVYSFSHAKINVARVGNLLSQGYLVEVESTREWLIDVFKAYLDSVPRAAVLFAQIYSLPEDPYFKETREKLLTTENEVFYVLSADDSSADRIKSVTKSSDGAHPPLLAFCSVLPEEFQRRGKLSADSLDFIVNNIKSIVLGAYDGDSYLVWNPDS